MRALRSPLTAVLLLTASPGGASAPIVLVTQENVAKMSAAFPLPPERYDDPFVRLLR